MKRLFKITLWVDGRLEECVSDWTLDCFFSWSMANNEVRRAWKKAGHDVGSTVRIEDVTHLARQSVHDQILIGETA